jgi:NCS1 family nucleobase:cation symporter-1
MLTEGEIGIERHAIEHIPESERHGRPWNLFTLWFASNVQINALVTGALAVYVGLDLPWAIVAILVGNLAGGIFMAYHSVQGSQLGVPQMIQSRAQFGFRGAVLPMAITIIMYLGFAIEGGVLAGQTIANWIGAPIWVGIVIFNVVLLVIALIGYDLIHSVSKVLTVISAVVFAALFVSLASDLGSVPAGQPVTWQTVLLAISIYASWQITWAPYVSDYSRYLPKETPLRKTFWYTYLGSALGASFAMMIGAFAVFVAGDAFGAGAVGFLSGRFPGLEGLLIIALLLSIVPAGAEGPYGAFLTGLAAASERGVSRADTPAVRAAFVTVFTIVATVIAVAASEDLLATFTNVILFVLYLLVPWTAINLTDYYIVRRGRYSIPELFKRDGLYGFINWRAVILYLVTIAIELPFINTPLYQGPISVALDGADLAWILGLVIPTVGYYVLVPRRPEEPETLVTGDAEPSGS